MTKVVADDSKWRKLLADVTQLSRRSVRVGVFDNAGSQNGVSLAEIAAFHEFGTSTVPERSFLRATFYGHAAGELRTMVGKLTKAVFAGRMDEAQALGLLGTWAAARVKQTIRNGIAPALEPATIKAKGSSLPLVDTGQLINSITHVVETK